MVSEREYRFFKGDCPPEEDPFAPEFARLLKEAIGPSSNQQPSPHLSDVTLSPQTLKQESTTPEYQQSDAFLNLPAYPEPSYQDASGDDAFVDESVGWVNDTSSWMEFTPAMPRSPVPTRSALSHSITAPAPAYYTPSHPPPLPAPFSTPVYHTPSRLPPAPVYPPVPMYNEPSYPQPVPRPFVTPVYGVPRYLAPTHTYFEAPIRDTPGYTQPTAAPAYDASSSSFPGLGASGFVPPTVGHMEVPTYGASSHPFVGSPQTGTYSQSPSQGVQWVDTNDSDFISRVGGFSWTSSSADSRFQGPR